MPWWRARATWRLGAIIAGVWVLLVARLWTDHAWAVPAYLGVAAVAVVLAEIDQRTHLLPNWLTYPSFFATVVLLGAAAVLEGEPMRMVSMLGAAGVGVLGFLLLARFGDMGLGDVNFAATLALALGWLSWSAVLTGAVAAFVLGGAFSAVTIVVLGRDRAARLAFGPWLALGTLLGVLTSG